MRPVAVGEEQDVTSRSHAKGKVSRDRLPRSMKSMFVLATLLLALAIPAAALAQGAGDEQYQDPFGDEQSQPTPTATPAPTQAPSTSSQVQPAPTATAAPQTPPPSGGRQLPYTGADAGLLALAGAALLGAGLGLRRAVHER
jgi:LPXTG-motif cell wall-anchored protein